MKKEYLINAGIGIGFTFVIIFLLSSIVPETPEQRHYKEQIIQEQHSHEMERLCIRKKGHPAMVNGRFIDCEKYQGIELKLGIHHE